jgi:phosphoglycerate dehydrogenase-like enzyme
VYAVPLTYLASESDLVIVLAPGGNETFHIVDEGFLRRMKKTAILINVARGSLVDTDALIRVLKEGVIHGAGLDVIEGEPNVNSDHPLLHEPR